MTDVKLWITAVSLLGNLDPAPANLGAAHVIGALMSLQVAMAARQRFYEILAAASVPESEAVGVHVGLAALLSVSYRFDLALRGIPITVSGAHRKHSAANDIAGAAPVRKISAREAPALEAARPQWLPDHLHYNRLLQHAPADLARQLDLASAAAKAEAPDLQLFFGYSRLGFRREQLLELMELMGRMYPKMREELRTFLPGGDLPAGQVKQLASFG